MRHIGILTHYYNTKNLGGLLQAYALTILLRTYSYQAEQISFCFQTYDSRSLPVHRQLQPRHITVRKILSYFYQRIKRYLISGYLNQQNTIIKCFAQSIPHSSQVYRDLSIKQANKEYDIIITGSDQVWNLDQLPHFAFYGEFTTADKKVISYAASSGTTQFFPYAEKLFIKKLQRLDAISVREKTLKDYIEKITDKKATVVLDPTFLLSKQEWLKIANPAVVPNQKYIFCYFLGGKSAWQRKAARAYADKYGYELIHLPYIMQTIRPADIYLKGQGHYDVGPREFISLINGAECVFTDSFHGMAFSINFNKDFYVFNRDDKDGINSMTSRITDTLAMFGLTDRHITDTNAVLESKTIDYTDTNKILNQKKECSANWLLNALKD